MDNYQNKDMKTSINLKSNVIYLVNRVRRINKFDYLFEQFEQEEV